MDDGAARDAPVLRGVYDAVLTVLLLVGLPFLLLRTVTRRRWREGLAERLTLRLPPPPARPRIWIHAASAGEMVAAAALATALEGRGGREIVLSSTTSAGVAVARRLLPGRVAFVLPLDLRPLVRRVLAAVRPEALVLVELELWPNLLAESAGRGVFLAVANGRIGATTARRLRRPWVRRLLGLPMVRLFAVQNDEYQDRLRGLGVPPERVVVTGNLKVDVRRGGADRAAVRARLGVRPEDRVVVAGSTHPGEEGPIARAVALLRREPGPPIHLVVAPRHLERLADAERNLQDAAPDLVRWTRRCREPGGREGPATVVVDTMGELADLYAAADVAIVGGSLVAGVGGHNVFEPVLAGARTLVGAHHKNVRSDVLFLESVGAIRVVPDPTALVAELRRALAGGPAGESPGRAALAEIRGAAERTAELLEERCWSGRRKTAETGTGADGARTEPGAAH